jgi:cysteine desulfurase
MFDGPIVLSAVEHPSISVHAELKNDARIVAVDGYGRVDLESVAKSLPGAALCTVMFANNEVGTIQPVAELSELCRAAGVLFHVDASQALGKIPINVSELGADLITLSSHKVYGPPGVGALWIRPQLDWKTFIAGGHQERGRRAGTENVLGIVGFGAAAAEITSLLERSTEITDRRDRLAKQLGEIWPIQRFSPTHNCLPNTLTIGFPPCDGETVLISLDLAGISVSTGSACSAGSLDPSPVLLAMGHSTEVAKTAVRFSLGAGTTDKEIDETVEIVKRVIPAIAEELQWV